MKQTIVAVIIIVVVVGAIFGVVVLRGHKTTNSSSATTSPAPAQQTPPPASSSTSPNPAANSNPSPTPAPSATTTAPTQNAVTISGFAFSPASISVKKGTTVTWTNQDSAPHTVTVDSGSGPSSKTLNKGDSYSFTFDQAGTFAYHCSVHPSMHGTVTVEG